MPSKLSIANLALRELGASTVVDLDTENTKEANLINDFWDLLLEEVLEAHTWDFAKTTKSLADDADFTMADDKWEYAYSLPSDFIRMGRKKANDFAYERRGQHLLTNETPCVIEYIKQETDPTRYPSHFAIVFSARLRASLSIPLAKKGTRAVDWMKLYYEVSLPLAKNADAHQSNMSVEDTTGHSADTDSWVGLFD
ncbi:hypothetical protein KAR91_11945 [Candidatus Pacearchaeota archaeon]|nr:hypothetical protein [Candidatus Pacearchaeota archaeon]